MTSNSDGGAGVLFLWDADYPWDVRVEKICTTLLKAGCSVHLVCRNTLGRAGRRRATVCTFIA